MRPLALLRACHPEPTAAVTVVAVLLAVVVGRGPAGTVAVGAAVLASQLAVGWSNDWLDAGRDAAVGRRDKPLATGAVDRRVVGAAAVLAAVATVPLALLPDPGAGLWLVLGLVAGLAYNWPLKFTPFSPVPYLIAFGALVAFVTRTPPWWLVTAASLLGGGAHFMNVLPDLAADAHTGVRGLPQRLGPTGSWLVGSALLLAATGVLVFGRGRPSWGGVATLAAAVVLLPTGWLLSRRYGARAAFRTVLVVALADVVLLLASGTAR